MMHSQLPVFSLLCALLMLPLGMPEILSNVPFTDSGVKRARAFAVHQFNKEHNGSPNYFKLLRFLTAESPVVPQVEYHLTVVLLETACKKETGKTKSYKQIQKCKELPGNPYINCYFKVTSHHGDTMTLDIKRCSDSQDRRIYLRLF